MLVLALFGVAYTSVTRRPVTLYWLALAPFIIQSHIPKGR
jgi:hypothetical protein